MSARAGAAASRQSASRAAALRHGAYPVLRGCCLNIQQPAPIIPLCRGVFRHGVLPLGFGLGWAAARQGARRIFLSLRATGGIAWRQLWHDVDDEKLPALAPLDEVLLPLQLILLRSGPLFMLAAFI